jgi:hypothetical protein
MMKLIKTLITTAVLVGVAAAVASGTSGSTLPDTSQATTFTATVNEQAAVSVPATATFSVTNVAASTATSSQTVSATNVALTNGKKLRIEIQANAATFTPPTGTEVTWNASDVNWNAATWTNGTGASGSLSSSEYTKVVDMTSANSASLTTTALVFTLAAKSSIDRAGDYTLACTWKFSSFTPT